LSDGPPNFVYLIEVPTSTNFALSAVPTPLTASDDHDADAARNEGIFDGG